MISRSDTHDTARGHKRAAASTLVTASSNRHYCAAPPRSVVTTQWAVKRLILTLLWALMLSTSTYALA